MALSTERPPLSDEAWVIRGGLMDLVALDKAIHTCDHKYGFFGLSFFGENDLSIAEIAEAAGQNRLPQGRIRATTMARLREIECEPIREGPWPHLSLKFTLRPTDSELEKLVAVFDPDIANPLFGN